MLELYILFFEVIEECINGCATLLKLGPCSSTRLKLNFAYTSLSSRTPFIHSYTPYRTQAIQSRLRKGYPSNMVGSLCLSPVNQLISVHHNRPKLQIGRRASHLYTAPSNRWIPQCSYSNSYSDQEYCPACQIFNSGGIDQYH
jgi:hypothetical protein